MHCRWQHILIFILLALVPVNCRKHGADSSKPFRLSALPEISFSQSKDTVECYDIVEVSMQISTPAAKNPFTEVFVSGKFGLKGQTESLRVTGFCDSSDGHIYRIRFMPSHPGDYSYSIQFWQDNLEKVHSGNFKAVDSGQRGLLRVDPAYPWHFLWEGTREHYFLNGTTAFLLMGWEDENVIRKCLDRLHHLSVNRLRVLLDGRTDHFWTEPIKASQEFHAYVNPWEARHPEDVQNPGFDYARFNCSYWQKFEQMLIEARERDIIVSVIFGYNDTPIHPAEGSEEERRYFEYAISRLSAYSNVTWDLGDDLDGFRSEVWTHSTGMRLQDLDPYHHLATSHPVLDNQHQDRTSAWFGMTSFQRWERPLHGWMLEQRQIQARTGRIIPQVNEEYGYEDHYPAWAPFKPPAASAEANRRTAWEIAMAGCYQTTGETAKRGTGVAPDTGGGWVNGRGDDTMVMLKGYAHMVHFFTSFEWWKMEPHDELVTNNAFCLSELGEQYVVYISHGGNVTVRLEPGQYKVKWFNPRNGQEMFVSTVKGMDKTTFDVPDKEDWILFIQRKK
jgi:hypothetical protein